MNIGIICYASVGGSGIVATELGKALAQRIVPELEGEDEPELAHDASTNALIRRYRRLRGR